MSFRSRIDYWAAFRARVALAALRRGEPVESIAKRFGASSHEVATWRDALERDAALSFAMADMDAIAPLEAGACSDEPARLAELVEALAEHDRRIAALQDERNKLTSQVFALAAEIEPLRQTLKAVLESLSWRLTRPLRLAGGSLESLPASALDAPESLPLPPPGPLSADMTVPDVESRLASDLADAQAAGIPFDLVFYTDAYPDVRGFPGGAFRHYLAHGRAEGRMAMLPPYALLPRTDGSTPTDAVLVVSHEASRSGAPILSLELVQQLRRRYTVVALLMGPGTIADDFRREADLVVGPLPRIQTEALVSLVIARLADAFAFRFAIVNSIGSRLVLPELARRFVPTVTLIHEYAAYTRPRSAFAHALFWSGESVFSAEAVRENALATLPQRWPHPIPVLRQGRCVLGSEPLNGKATAEEAERVRAALRPEGWPEDTVVVAGVGQVHIRKGVDLFVACAKRVLESLEGRSCRFVWIGSGFDPEVDVAFSNYLEDQIERSGLGDRFALLHETSRIDVAYAASDVLLVTSRLDPLPNVGIDAMYAGIALACFDGATGLAEVLREHGIADECVLPYLDVEAMARRVTEWVGNPARRRNVASRLAVIAPRAFDMTAYAGEVEQLALAAAPGAVRERRDYATVVESERFDTQFVAGAAPVADRPAVARGYVRAWAVGAFRRKPFPGFHPGVFAACGACPEKDADPFAAFLRAGEPEGPWLTEVVRSDSPVPPFLATPDALLHVWLAIPGAATVLARGLRANASRPRLVVSVTSKALEAEALAELGDLGLALDVRRSHPGDSVSKGLFEAIAKGDAPAILGQLTLEGGHGEAACLTGADVSFAVEHLVGGTTAFADALLGRFASDTSLGIIWPEDPRVFDAMGGDPEAVTLARLLGFASPPESPGDFPSAGAFWIRTDLLAPLAADLSRTGYAGEFDLPFRRLMPFLAARMGLRHAVTNVSRCPR